MDLVEKSIAFVKQKFSESNTELLTYHNWKHTKKVFDAATVIATNTPEFDTSKLEELQIASIFHDVGFLDGAKNHEERSVEIATAFLKKENYAVEKIEFIKRLILSTKMEHKAIDLFESIMKDADLYHLGSSDYMQTTFVDLSEEINNHTDEKICETDWLDMSVSFLSKHKYLTQFAQDEREESKKKNIEKMNDIKVKSSTKEEAVKSKNSRKKKKSSKDDIPLKGVETMFKVSLKNHVTISQIADNKANTLISVNAIIISIVLSTLFPKLDSNPYLFYPGLSFLLFTIVTIVLSILSTIPNVNNGVITKKEVLSRKGNLLFFGNFFRMDLEEYEWSMRELMNDKDYLYGTLSRDLYFLGKVLHKKYKLLRYAYYSFVFGLIASIIIFITTIFFVLKTV